MITRKQLRAFCVRNGACENGLAKLDYQPGTVRQVLTCYAGGNYQQLCDLRWLRLQTSWNITKMERDLHKIIESL